MTGVLVASAFFISGYFAAQGAPSNLQTDGKTNPTVVTDHRPDFTALNNRPGPPTNRFQIQLSTPTDPTFLAPLWSSPGPNSGTNFPGNATVPTGSVCPPIPYGQGTANLLSLPLLDWTKSYIWRTRFARNNNWSPFSSNAQFTMATPTWTVAQQQNNGSPTSDSWRFVGVPIAFGTTVPASELLNSVGLLYRLDEPSRTWVQLGPTDVLQGGQGYLAWCSPSTTFTLSQGKVTAGIPAVINASGVTTTPSYNLTTNFSFTTLAAATGQEIADGVGVNGYRGNVLFANPFYAPISWRSSVTNGPPYGDITQTNISFAMYKWDGTQYLTYNGATNVGSAGEFIEPFQAVGIWVQATPYSLKLNTPAPINGGALKAVPLKSSALPVVPTSDPDRWHLMVEAQSGTALDTENAFGIDPEADDAWDVRDSEEPGPGAATWVNVYFDHRTDWTTYPRKYTHDFRKTPLNAGDQVVWQFTVDGNTNLPATLTWSNLADISPVDWKFTLEDPANSATVDLTPGGSYDTLPVNGPTVLTLKAVRLTSSPANSPAPSSSGSNCGLLGPEGLLIAAWILARRACKMRTSS